MVGSYRDLYARLTGQADLADLPASAADPMQMPF
jgi:hypothetical protein